MISLCVLMIGKFFGKICANTAEIHISIKPDKKLTFQLIFTPMICFLGWMRNHQKPTWRIINLFSLYW